MKQFLLLVALSGNLAYGQYSLGLHLDKGHVYLMHVSAKAKGSNEMEGKKMDFSAAMNGISRIRVLEAGEQEFTLEASYDTLHMTMMTPMGRSEFSTSPSLREMAGGKADPMNLPHLLITVSKNGSIKKIMNPDTTGGMLSILKNLPMLEAMKRMMMMRQTGSSGQQKKSNGHKAMKERMELITAVYPDKKVGLHEHWGHSFQADSVLDQMVSTDFELLAYGGGVATIRGHAESKKVSMPKKGPGFPVDLDIASKVESNFSVDAASGWIKSGDFSAETKGQVQIKDSKAPGGARNMPFQLTATISIKAD